MSRAQKAQEDFAAGVIPPVLPTSSWRLSSVEVLEGYALKVRFLDGTEGYVRMAELICSPSAGVFAELRDPDRFAEVYLEYGAVTWPDGIDLAPDAMYDAIKARGEWVLTGRV